MAEATLDRVVERTFLIKNPSVMIFITLLAVLTIGATFMSEAFGVGILSTSFIKTLGKTLCLCLIALAMDLVWGYCGILSLGHFAFFGLGGYMIGMWLMYERTKDIVIGSLAGQPLPATPEQIRHEHDKCQLDKKTIGKIPDGRNFRSTNNTENLRAYPIADLLRRCGQGLSRQR
ncbi:MAG: hypothetical protein AAFR39_14610, partial [Pseudomonadota bacterium]